MVATYEGRMTTSDGSMTFANFFDSVLGEIESGKVEQGINLLVGMLDAVYLHGASTADVRDELARHPLLQMLLEDPICAYAANRPGDYAGLLDMACGGITTGRTSSTGLKLFEATSNLPLIRALRKRRATVNQKLERAWKAGHRICFLGTSENPAHGALSGRDLSNVTIIDCDAAHWPITIARSGPPFDLICLSEVADTLNAAALCALLTQLRSSVSPTGIAILSAVRPGHLGSGWRSVCLGWAPMMHDASTLQRVALDAGFSAQTYNDQSDCIIWAELKPQNCPTM